MKKNSEQNSIVIMENHFIDLPLRNFSASEIDILMAICFKCQNEETNEVRFTFEELMNLADYKTKDKQQFIKKVMLTNKKLINLNITITSEDKKVIKQFVLFSDFEIDSITKELKVRVHDPFSFLLNRLTSNFTLLELETSASFKTTYAKQIYKKLRQYKNFDNPFWSVTIEDFKNYLDIPESYQVKHIEQKVIKPALSELKPHFNKLECIKVYEATRQTTGKPKIVGYKFSYINKEKKEKQTEEIARIPLIPNPSLDRLAEKTGWKKIGKYCPHCRREVYLKTLKSEYGEYPLLGHPDFRTGECKWSTKEYGDLISKERVELLEEIENTEPTFSEEETKKRMEELQNKLKDIFK